MGRDIKQCHPVLQNKAKELVELCEKKGLKIKITECFRSVAEQDELYAQGRTKKGNIVTNAKGSTYSSMHQWGVAFDICRNDGKGAYNNDDGFFKKVGKIGQSIGLEWGGSWTSIVDLPHFQLPDWGSTSSKLKSIYGTVDKFKKTWVAPKYEPKQYTFTAISALRNSMEVNDTNRVKYKTLSDAVQKKCFSNTGGYANIKVGSEFTITKIYEKNGNYWGKTKSGYYVLLEYKGTKRVK